jgi:hypothetical protein
MSDNSNNPTDGRTALEKQALRLLDNASTVIGLVSQLEDGVLGTRSDVTTQWTGKYSFYGIARAFLMMELQNWSESQLYDHLRQHHDIVEQLGLDGVPARSTFNRSFDRLPQATKDYLEHNAKRIREHAIARGHPIGIQAPTTNNVDSQTIIPSTHPRKAAIARGWQNLQPDIFDEFDFLPERANNTQYSREDFLTAEWQASLTQTALEQATTISNDLTPATHDVPDADTILHYLRQLDEQTILNNVHNAIGLLVNRAKRRPEFTRPVTVAIDMTYVAYYGDRDEIELVTGSAPSSKDYDYCHKYGTISIVRENVRFILGLVPVDEGSEENDTEVNEKPPQFLETTTDEEAEDAPVKGTVVRELLEIASKHVRMSTVYADAEFAACDVVAACEEYGVDYVIPKPKTPSVKRFIKRMNHDIAVKQNYAMYGHVRGQSTNTRVETNLVAVPSSKTEGKTVAFITNKDVRDEIQLDRDETQVVIDRYNRRWGAEVSYRSLKDFLAWTTSKEYPVRLFHFSFAVVMYDCWRLTDFTVQLEMDCDLRYKPRVKAKRFLHIALNALRPGG